MPDRFPTQVGFLPSSGHAALCKAVLVVKTKRMGEWVTQTLWVEAKSLLTPYNAQELLPHSKELSKSSARRLGNSAVDRDKQTPKDVQKIAGWRSATEDNCTVTNNRQCKVTFLLLQVSHALYSSGS